MKSTISIKGTREGLTITLGPGELVDLLGDLTKQLANQGEFFRGGTVALQVGERAMEEEDLKGFSEALGRYEMVLRSVMTSNPDTEQAVRASGLRLISQQPVPESAAVRSLPPSAHPLDGSKGILVRHVVRSGQILRHTGHIVIIGDVNAGAEVVAGGDIVVWGRLQGRVHAGMVENDQALVCALEMAPLQLRIGQFVARSEERERGRITYPAVALVRDSTIIVEPWDRLVRGR